MTTEDVLTLTTNALENYHAGFSTPEDVYDRLGEIRLRWFNEILDAEDEHDYTVRCVPYAGAVYA